MFCDLRTNHIYINTYTLYYLNTTPAAVLPGRKSAVQPSERLTSLGIMEENLDPPKTPQTSRHYDTEGFQGGSQSM